MSDPWDETRQGNRPGDADDTVAKAKSGTVTTANVAPLSSAEETPRNKVGEREQPPTIGTLVGKREQVQDVGPAQSREPTLPPGHVPNVARAPSREPTPTIHRDTVKRPSEER